MTKTLVNLDPADKDWLDREARSRRIPMTELVRRAVRDYRLRLESQGRPTLQAALERTAGLWRHGDGATYQRRLREEWDQRE